MSWREDRETTDLAGAAHVEELRSLIAGEGDVEVTAADVAGLSDGGEHDCTGDGCLVCLLDRMRAA